MTQEDRVPATPQAIARAREYIQKYPSELYDAEILDVMAPWSKTAIIRYTRKPDRPFDNSGWKANLRYCSEALKGD